MTINNNTYVTINEESHIVHYRLLKQHISYRILDLNETECGFDGSWLRLHSILNITDTIDNELRRNIY